MSRDDWNRNPGQRYDRDQRYASDEREMTGNRDYSGYYGPRRGNDPSQGSRDAWESGGQDYRGDYRGSGSRDDDRNERSRDRFGGGNYRILSAEDYGQGGQRGGYRDAQGREGREAWERNRYDQEWDAGRYTEQYGYPREEDRYGRNQGSRQLGYGSDQRFGQGRYESQYNSPYGNYGQQGQGQYGNREPYGSERGRFGQNQYGNQEGYGGDRGRFDFRSEQERRLQRSHFGRGPRGYKRSDERIREDVSDRFYQDHDIDASEIEVRVTDGHVTLEGAVHSRDIKRQAEDLADSVLGVNDVTNHLRVKREDESTTTASTTTLADNGQKPRNSPSART